MMKGEIRRIEQVARKQHKAGLMKGPRQFCAVCGKVFDFATVNPTVQLVKARCSDCKALLAEGYTAVISNESFAFIKSDFLKLSGASGKIVPVSDEAFAKIIAKQKELEKRDDGIPP